MAARIRIDDIVEIISGANKGARGKVLKIDHERQRLVVEGCNMVIKHVRRNQQQPRGDRVHKEAPIHMSNVQPIDPKTDKPTRVRFEVERNAQGHVQAKRRMSVGGTLISDVTRSGKGGE